MKIVVDAYNISLEHGTGVATYGRGLVGAATALGHEVGVLFGASNGSTRSPLLNEIALAEGHYVPPARAWRKFREGAGALQMAWRTEVAREIRLSGDVIFPPRLQLPAAHIWNAKNIYRRAIGLYRRFGAGATVHIDGVDLAHWTYPLPIAASRGLNVYTLHDLVPLRLPYATADRKRDYYKLCQRIVDTADHILTVSEASKRDIVNILGVPEHRVTNTYQSVDVGDFLGSMTEESLETYVRGLTGFGVGQYFMYFGAIEPKKNVARILEGYLGSGTRNPLVIVGAPGWGGESDAKLLKSLKALDVEGRIKWLSYLPRDMLANLIAGARATIFPSLYEGFGLPVAESMALGTPVITSRTSSLPEVAGEAAILVDPYRTSEIAAAIKTLDADGGLRAELAMRGREQALRFSPQAYQQRLGALYAALG